MINNQQKIQNEWTETKLQNVGDFSKGRGISKAQLSNNGINAIRYGELYTKHNIKINKIYSYISNSVASQSKKIKQGDIIFAGSGETIDEIGKSAVYLKNDDCFAGGDTIIFSSKNQSSLFIAYSLNVGMARRELRKLGQGQSVVHIYKKDLEKLKLNLPPLPEQNRIVEILEAWDSYLEKLEKKIKIKKKIKKGLMQQLLTGKKRLPGFNGKRKEVKLEEICKRFRTGKLDANAMSEGGEYRFYTCAKNYYKIDDFAFDTEALLISGNGANVGYIHYYKGKFNAYQRTYVLDKFIGNIFFVKYFLDNFLRKRIFLEKADGNTPYIKMDTLTNMKLTIPNTITEQTAVAEILTTADEEIEVLEKQRDKIEAQKKYLLNNLITGKIRVPKHD